jgi:hypothetical protein
MFGCSFAGEGAGGSGGGNGEGGEGDEGGSGGGGGTGGGGTAVWTDSIDVSRRTDPTIQKYKSADELAKAHIDIQKLVGMDKLPLPKKPYTESPDDYGIVFDRLGRPSDPNAYKIPEIKDLPADFPKASEEDLKAFKTLAHKIGLMPHQVEALYKYQVDQTKNVLNGNAQASESFRVDSEKFLRKEWGKSFDTKLQTINKGLKKFGDEQFEQLLQGGLGNHPAFARFLDKVFSNFGEDGEFIGEPKGAGMMTPDEAKSAIPKFREDQKKILSNKLHPEYKAVTEQLNRLYQFAYPENK